MIMKDKNLSAVLEYPINYEQYIEKRLREIEDLDERRFAKTVLLEGMGKAIQRMEEKYQALERRVYEEIEVEANQYETVTTIINKKDYDPMNATLFPVCMEDLEEGCHAGQLPGEGEAYIGTVFLEADEKTARQFQRKGFFTGTYPEREVQDAVFCVRPAQRYREQLERLYHTFQDNHIPWETIHTGFLDKFFDVFLKRPNGMGDDAVPDFGPVEADYGEFGSFVRQDIIPLWNIEYVSFDSTHFIMPCIDGIYYEHEFAIPDADREDGYLIRTNEDILEIRHEAGKIIMKSRKETFGEWQALHVVQKETVRSLGYTAPLLTNHKKGSFFGKLSGKTHMQLLTKTDLFRRIMELDIAEYIEATGYEICDNIKDYPMTEGMNWFVMDDLFPMEGRKVLLLKFTEKKQGHYLNDSMVRFVTSQIQLEIGEYRCVGLIGQ